jgi:heme exporter protein A
MMLVAGTSLACTRGGLPIFRDVNFTAKAGEALVLTGPNGSGKTTLLRVIAGLLRPSEGAVRFEGAGPDVILAEEAHYLAHLDPLKPSLTVAENLNFWTEFLGGASTADEALRAVRLERLAGLPAGYLSAGQRRRLSLARLLAVQRPIWLLDEPTAALDAAGQVILADMMRQHLASGGLIIAATHGPLGLDGAKTLEMGEGLTSPRSRGEVDARSAAGQGDSPSAQTRGDAPSPGLLRNPTSPRKRGEVKATLASFYYQRRVAGEPISALVLADGKAGLVLGFSTQWSSPSPAHPYRYGGAVRPAPLAPDIADALSHTVQRLTSLTGLVGLNSFDFLVDGRTFHLLEINPRPGATIDIFEPPGSQSLFALHVDACAGRLPDRTPVVDGAAASAVVYALADIPRVPSFDWPDWSADRPIAGSSISAQSPLCTVLASAATAAQARELVEQRAQTILARSCARPS